MNAVDRFRQNGSPDGRTRDGAPEWVLGMVVVLLLAYGLAQRWDDAAEDAELELLARSERLELAAQQQAQLMTAPDCASPAEKEAPWAGQ